MTSHSRPIVNPCECGHPLDDHEFEDVDGDDDCTVLVSLAAFCCGPAKCACREYRNDEVFPPSPEAAERLADARSVIMEWVVE